MRIFIVGFIFGAFVHYLVDLLLGTPAPLGDWLFGVSVIVAGFLIASYLIEIVDAARPRLRYLLRRLWKRGT